jgi:hypothetical protein
VTILLEEASDITENDGCERPLHSTAKVRRRRTNLRSTIARLASLLNFSLLQTPEQMPLLLVVLQYSSTLRTGRCPNIADKGEKARTFQ